VSRRRRAGSASATSVTRGTSQPVAERVRATVDLAAVERNCRHMRSLLRGRTALCAVVKADGYGHGAVPCGLAAQRAGAAWLAVVTAGEADELRHSDVAGRVLVMGALTSSELARAVEARADVVAWTQEFVAAAATAARATGVPVGVHVKLDTGMGRLGTTEPDEARHIADVTANSPGLELVGLMTHFATADEPGDTYFPAQLERFSRFASELRAVYPELLVHAANSAATYRDRAAHFDLVRCGVALYGLDPFQEDPTRRGLEPALLLESYVASVKRFEPGKSAGYGRLWRAPARTCVGVLPIGYGDGWRRAFSNNAAVLVRGQRRALVGAVSMDNITVDLGPETDVQPGDPAVLIGRQGDEHIVCEEVAARIATINYEITCGLSQRVPRVHSAS
jgi:alanine racemase